MREAESQGRTPARELIMGVLVILVVGAAIILTVWAMRLRAREEALRSPVPPPAPRAAETEKEAVVGEKPPASIAEEMPAAPGPAVDFVWIGGWWEWEGGWVWHRGHWAHRPHAGAVWVSPGWVHGPPGWIFSRGHWR
jgi:hypothetical protein